MTIKYDELRQKKGFRWFAAASPDAFLKLTGIAYKDYYLNPLAGIELFKKGRPLCQEMFGADVNCMGLTTPPLSYGHVNGLGAELIIPDGGGEVNHAKMCDNLEDAIKIVSQDIDFSQAGMAPFYVEYREKLMAAFPEEDCGFFFKREGPISTAHSILDEELFYQPYDEPERFKEFLRLETNSIVQFVHFYNQVLGGTAVCPNKGMLADDIAAMFSPDLWPEFVLPYWNQYYRGVTTGQRNVHVEDLTAKHLPFLEEMSIVDYEPSISPKINPAVIRENCRVPFGWRLGSFHYPALSEQDVADFIFQAVADGASYVFTVMEGSMCTEETAQKVKVFTKTAKEVEIMLSKGVSRNEIGKIVSASGKRKFWSHWPE